jgi:hypothetical protein
LPFSLTAVQLTGLLSSPGSGVTTQMPHCLVCVSLFGVTPPAGTLHSRATASLQPGAPSAAT